MDFKYINVSFDVSSDFNYNSYEVSDSKLYTFRCAFAVEKGDLAVCETRNGLTVVRVIGEEFRPEKLKIAKAWLIQKVDLENHKQQVSLMEEKENLREKMLFLQKRLEEEAVFAKLAEQNQEMQNLLQKYKNL